MSTTGQEEFTLDTAAELAAEEGGGQKIQGRSPWALAGRRLRRNRVALAAIGVFLLVVVCCLLGPVYVSQVSHIAQNDVRSDATVVVNGKTVNVISQGHTRIVKGVPQIVTGGIPIGPQWGAAGGKYILGGDELGRDIGTRLLYGGRNSLFIGVTSAAIATIASVILALLAGYFGGVVDWIISRFFDLIWAFPVILLAIALGTALSVNGFHHFGINLVWLEPLDHGLRHRVRVHPVHRPTASWPGIGVAQPRVRRGRNAPREQAAVRIMFTELLPNIASSVLVLFTLIIANAILTEVGLSFLGAGVQSRIRPGGR